MSALEAVTEGDAGWLSWLLLGVLVLTIPENVVYGDLVWTVFLAAAVVVLALPPLVARDPSVMLPPEVLALATLPAVTRTFWTFEPLWVGEYALYLAVAAVALAAVVEVTQFTDVEMAPWFADVTVVLATMAAIGVWAVLQFYSDQYLGTNLVGSLDTVMWEFIQATVAGVVAAVVFEVYFQVRAPVDAAGPGAMGEEDNAMSEQGNATSDRGGDGA